MAAFKFVCRETEISEILSAVKKNSIVLLHCQNNSGLTHFLKRVMQLLWSHDTACYYIDGESQMTIAQQIIGQTMMFSKDDSPEQNKAARLLKKHDKGDLAFAVVTSCLYALDAVPLLPSIGSIANSLITSIKESIDADQAHINDFKTEKAVSRFCEVLTKKQNKHLFLLIDNPQMLSSDELSFLLLLLRRFHIHILLPFSIETLSSEIEFISKFPSSQSVEPTEIYRIAKEFSRPDNKLIQELYRCYGAKFFPERLEYYEKCNRNIHIIMADIFGLPIDIGNVNPKFQYLLKVLNTIKTFVPQSVLFQVLRTENIKSMTCSDTDFREICADAHNLGLIRIELFGREQEQSYALNQQMLINGANQISFVERQSIIAASIKAMDQHIESLNEAMLTFAIAHLEHDYSHAKQYILAYARLLYAKRRYPLQYLDRLNYFDNLGELIFVIGLYYDCGVYDKPYHLLRTHAEYSRKLAYRVAKALICERLHIDNYAEKLEKVFDSIKDLEKQCLVAAVLFVAYLNTDASKKYRCFFDHDCKYYHGIFQSCSNYPYLLRNISYYMEDIPAAIRNYEKCLAFFASKDPVNYNRTISNYLCYLMRNDKDEIAVKHLQSLAREAKIILDYNDPSYSYLNNNYGIYLMRYTDKDPSSFFLASLFHPALRKPHIFMLK